MTPSVLLVDDDVELVTLLADYLRQDGFGTTLAHDGEAAIREALGGRHDIVVLDVMMPRMTGVEVLRRLRAQSAIPVLMLTARGDDVDRILGLELGADDYVPKPFEPRELSLRIANILKRAQPAVAPPVESVRFGPFVYHLARGELRKGEDIIRLTDREREMLRILTATPGETVSRMALAGSGEQTSERAVDVQVNRLRRKIEINPANPLFVQTVRGIGYRLVSAT